MVDSRSNWTEQNPPKTTVTFATLSSELPNFSSCKSQGDERLNVNKCCRWWSPQFYATESRTLISLTRCLNLAAQLVSAFIVSNYSPSHSMKGTGRIESILNLWERWNGQQLSCGSSLIQPTLICRLPTPLVSSFSNISVPMFLIDPSPAIFMSAVMIYCSAVLIYCAMEKDPLRDHFLMFGVVLGVVCGTLASWFESSLDQFKDYIPFSITAALAISLAWQALLSLTLGRYRQHNSA